MIFQEQSKLDEVGDQVSNLQAGKSMWGVSVLEVRGKGLGGEALDAESWIEVRVHNSRPGWRQKPVGDRLEPSCQGLFGQTPTSREASSLMLFACGLRLKIRSLQTARTLLMRSCRLPA